MVKRHIIIIMVYSQKLENSQYYIIVILYCEIFELYNNKHVFSHGNGYADVLDVPTRIPLTVKYNLLRNNVLVMVNTVKSNNTHELLFPII